MPIGIDGIGIVTSLPISDDRNLKKTLLLSLDCYSVLQNEKDNFILFILEMLNHHQLLV